MYIKDFIHYISKNNCLSMATQTPREGIYFGSVWIGAKLIDFNGTGSFEWVSHGPTLTKRSPYWW